MVLVLGGNGFIGHNICENLVKNGYSVVSYDIKHSEIDSHYERVNGDFFNDMMLFKIIDKADVIIDAIGTISTKNSDTNFMQGYEKEFLQTIKLFDYVSRNDKKLIFLSSGGTVYGDMDRMPIKENVDANPISHYGVIKLSSEKAAQVFNRKKGENNIIIVRLANPYGHGQNSKGGIGFIDAVIRSGLNNKILNIWGNGKIIRDYIYIDDVSEVIRTLICYQGKEKIFNVGTSIGTDQNKIVRIVRDIGLTVSVEYKECREVDVIANILDNKRVLSIYGKQLTTIKDGIYNYYCYLKKMQNKEIM